MAKKEFTYRGKTVEELKKMTLDEFAKLLPSREGRTIKRASSEEVEKLVKRLTKGEKNVKTHVRDAIITPQMIDHMILVHSGKEFVPVQIVPEMIGHRLGEFSHSRRRVQHSAPGVGATRSSAALSVR